MKSMTREPAAYSIYFALPQIKGVKVFKSGLSLMALRMMVFSMFLMVLALAVAGIVQTYLQRILGMDYLTTQEFMKLWFAVFWVSAWGFASGVVMYIIDFFMLGRLQKSME
jgi:nitric oxide reductase subunit B